MNPGVADKGSTAPFAISVQSAARAALAGVLNGDTASLFTAVVSELSSPTVLIDVRHLIAADVPGLAVVAAEDDLRRARHGRLMLVGSPLWLQTVLHEVGHQHLLPWIRHPATRGPGADAVGN